MKPRRPSHATVVAYIALFVALGGSAYAVSQVGSKDVADNSLRSRDLRDDGVTRRDVRDNTLTGKDIREKGLDATGFAAVTHGAGACDPASAAPVVCAEATIALAQPSRVLLIGSGGFFSEASPARSTCTVELDGQTAGTMSPGDIADNTSPGAVDGFTATGLSRVVAEGAHSVALECNEVAGDARISTPSIAAIALGTTRIK